MDLMANFFIFFNYQSTFTLNTCLCKSADFIFLICTFLNSVSFQAIRLDANVSVVAAHQISEFCCGVPVVNTSLLFHNPFPGIFPACNFHQPHPPPIPFASHKCYEADFIAYETSAANVHYLNKWAGCYVYGEKFQQGQLFWSNSSLKLQNS